MSPRIITPTHRTLGAALRAERLRQGLSQPQLARLADVSIPTVLTIEKAQRDPRLSSLTPIAAALGLRLALLPADE